MLSVYFVSIDSGSLNQKSIAMLLQQFESSGDGQLEIVVFVEKRRDESSVEVIIDINIDILSLRNVLSVSSDHHFINLHNNKLEDPLNASIDAFIFQNDPSVTNAHQMNVQFVVQSFTRDCSVAFHLQ